MPKIVILIREIISIDIALAIVPIRIDKARTVPLLVLHFLFQVRNPCSIHQDYKKS
jgi:hypothetical protein